MIEADLKAHMGEFRLSAQISTGGVTCIAGRNGSGKTSLLRAIAGLVDLDEGFVRVAGRDVTRAPVERRGVVLVTPASHFAHLDVDSHLLWGARLAKREVGRGQVDSVKSELGIDFGGPVRRLSLGMRERVALATALLAGPKAILVDEAFANLHERDAFVASYAGLAAKAGTDLVFTSQDEGDGRLAERLYVIADGSTTAR